MAEHNAGLHHFMMSTDRSLATLLRALQSPSASADDAGRLVAILCPLSYTNWRRLLASATTLLTLLTNPLNLGLLTSHLLTAPAIWSASTSNSPDIRTSLRILSTFHNAANHILHREDQPVPNAEGFLAAEGAPREQWVRAVVKGADDKSARWKHLLVLGGLLTGFEAHDRQGLPVKLRELLESAVVAATNLSLEGEEEPSSLDRLSILVVLAHSFDLLSPHERLKLNTTRLLPVLMQCVYFSKEGLHRGYFLGTIDTDIVQGPQNKLTWPERSTSFYQAQVMATGPIASALGSLSKLASFCVEAVPNAGLISYVLEDLLAFSKSLNVQWRQNKLSELDASEEELFLAQEALTRTIPMLWQVLKSTMFSVVIILNALITRFLRDPKVPIAQASSIAIQSLHILRNLYFISSRLGHNSFSEFNFVYNASIDILAKFPPQAEAFMRNISPKEFGRIPEHPFERCRDLFFFNTAEHLALELSPELSEKLYFEAAIPYLGNEGDVRLYEIFEAAHSVVLAVFSAPQNFDMTTQRLPFYIDTLFSVRLHHGIHILKSCLR